MLRSFHSAYKHGPSSGAFLKTTLKTTYKNEVLDEKSKKERLSGGQFRLINETFYTETSKETEKRLKNHKEYEWALKYHKGYAAQAQKWPAHPLDAIVPWIRRRVPKEHVILDMGCGTCRVHDTLCNEYKVISVDFAVPQGIPLPPKHETWNEYLDKGGLIESNIRSIPLIPSQSVLGCCVFCLSLMGTDWPMFIQEAVRIMKPGSTLVVAEIASRVVDVKRFKDAFVKTYGFTIRKEESLKDYFHILWFGIGVAKGKGKGKQSLLESTLLKPCRYHKKKYQREKRKDKKLSRRSTPSKPGRYQKKDRKSNADTKGPRKSLLLINKKEKGT
eukprot:Blabericola_migrator_1__7096@NODE_359_length_9439_cov_107_095070_g287_i0_p3_GENE_NODE_359_length_9439_cov_107_095070_g287_i0NODE_359_length_9439_cov_107_095070_g287_i0_p3_ORF_typecomplete_len331_score52_67Methyltransf_8/PF05148_15/1_5e52Methyltransf_23/PF13489_6/0_00036Ubie_methyltran/PF01209_18/8_8e05Methyltransf_31/PF13847_6/0_00042Methyltransf_11/PF08241_12/0_0016Methyltransf_25/PF13649_6/0_0028MetW/PF07021_12/0_037_NODE_359_length_9439_cov_107_095070_g287_i027013693